MMTKAAVLFALALVPACVAGDTDDSDIEDGENDNLGPKEDGFGEGSSRARAILALVNDTTTDVERLDVDAGLSSRVANNIIARRGMGYATLAALDAVPYVGPVTLQTLYDYAKAHGYEMAEFKNVVTEWEFQVGSGGDAWVNDVTIAPGGGLLVTSTFPRWFRKVTSEGKSDETWGLPEFSGSTRRSGFLDLPAHEVWNVDGGGLVAASGDGDLFYLQGYLANGTPDPAFGAAGRIDLYSEGHRLRVAHDADHRRFLVVFARAWETFGFYSKGPSKIELIAYDQATGQRSSIGVYDLPPWDNDGTKPAKIHEVLPRPDGTVVLLVSETVHIPNPSRADVATQWSTIRLVPGQPPQVTHIAVTSYDPRVVAFASLGNGGFDLYLWGTVDGISMAYNEEKLVRVSVDDAGAAKRVALVGADLSKGCASATATSTHLVVGQAIDRSLPIQFAAYPKSGGAPITFASDVPQRCLSGLTLAPNGRMYGGTTDTSGGVWVYRVTSFAPAAQ